MLSRKILAVLIIAVPMQALGGPSACYKKDVEMADIFSGKPYQVTDFLTLEKADEGKSLFRLLQNGSNGHMCSISGYAKRKANGKLVFKDTKPHWLSSESENNGLSAYMRGTPCEIQFSLSKESVSISATTSCSVFCGARAGLGGTLQVAKECPGPSL